MTGTSDQPIGSSPVAPLLLRNVFSKEILGMGSKGSCKDAVGLLELGTREVFYFTKCPSHSHSDSFPISNFLPNEFISYRIPCLAINTNKRKFPVGC